MDLLEVIKAQRSDLLGEEDTIIAASPKAGLKPDAKVRLDAIHVELADLDAWRRPSARARRTSCRRRRHWLTAPTAAAACSAPAAGTPLGGAPVVAAGTRPVSALR